jgi:2-iminoacetate synthase
MPTINKNYKIIDCAAIRKMLVTDVNSDKLHVRVILQKALELHGLSSEEVAVLIAVNDKELLQEIFTAAKKVKENIYGKRLVLFAPLYISNLCTNQCLYCAFCATNNTIKRRCLNQEEIAEETKALIQQGHKRVLLLAGESYPGNNFQYVLDAIATVYKQRCGHGVINRVNVNIAPLTIEDFKLLKQSGIGTYQLFQETYDCSVYKKFHVAGPKADYNWRLTAIDRAMEAGIDDVGVGALFGLTDWRFEVLALLAHANYLQHKFGVGPHTISVPRLEPAVGSELASNPPHPVSDTDFCKIVAILRLAVPYTGIIMSTRETPELRRTTFELGVSQISAGSRTNPGGYMEDNEATAGQFAPGDNRTLEEVVKDIATLGYTPSFCTACYRVGRTGEDFMCLAKPGDIKQMCIPNSLVTFQEYLIDYASLEVQTIGAKVIARELALLPRGQQQIVAKLLARIKSGERDLYV